MLDFGLPTVPADASVYALQVADRWYLLRAQSAGCGRPLRRSRPNSRPSSSSPYAASSTPGRRSPTRSTTTRSRRASTRWSRPTTCSRPAIVVAGVALLGRWGIRLLLAPDDFGAHRALPWLALGWALYGLYLIFIVISGRARRTRRNLPAALVGIAVNIGCLFLFVPPLGIAGAGIALVIAYAAMILAIHLLTRRLFTVSFEWDRLLRLVAVFAAISVAGELLLPTHGLAGFLLRGAAWCLLIPALRAAGFFRAAELERIGGVAARALRAVRRPRSA